MDFLRAIAAAARRVLGAQAVADEESEATAAIAAASMAAGKAPKRKPKPKRGRDGRYQRRDMRAGK